MLRHSLVLFQVNSMYYCKVMAVSTYTNCAHTFDCNENFNELTHGESDETIQFLVNSMYSIISFTSAPDKNS